MRLKKKFYLKLPAIIFGIGIFSLSQIPNEMIPQKVFDWQDKVLHFMLYFLFGISLIIATITIESNSRRSILVLVIGIFYALLDEIHQLFVPGRVCDFTDWLADSLGIAFSLLFLKMLGNWLSKKLDWSQ